MPHCLQCSHDNPAGGRFCANCGNRLALRCEECGEPARPEQRFCTACGAALIAAPATPPAGPELGQTPVNYTPPHLAQQILGIRQTLYGEKKQVTVLFCDVVDSTALAVGLGAEGMHSLLSDFFARALAEVHRFEGSVNQFLGDGFMAIFGAPFAYEDHAARAGLAAMAIRDAIAQTRVSSSLPGWSQVQVRMGLNSGQVVIGTIGDDLRMDYTAVGDITHIAARLQSAAAPGEILCGIATVNAAHGALQAEALAPAKLKGIEEPVVPHRLLSAHEHTNRAAHQRTLFVGRDSELAELLDDIERASQGQGGVVEVEGEPGAGKSRLMLELQTRLSATTCVVMGHCITYGNQRPNVPVIELVRALLATEAGEGDSADVDLAERAGMNYLAALLGDTEAQEQLKNMDPATLRGRTTKALIAYTLYRAKRDAVVLIVEDLHWVDPSSLEILSMLAAALPGTRCLLVVTFRPGSDPPWPTAVRQNRIGLGPLQSKEAHVLLGQLLASSILSAELQAQVLARAEGNPFFLEELTRAAITTNEQIPGDVFDVLASRIDRLAASDKRNLRVAAAIGREFSLDLVEEAATGPHTHRARFENLTTLGFIEPTPVRRRYRFVHALTQEVAYQGMLSGERKQLHTALATRLSKRARQLEDDCEEIARHHLAGESPSLALPFLKAATAKAIRNHTLEAAHGYVIDAMRLFEAHMTTSEQLIECVVYLLQAFPIFHFLHKHREYSELLERYAPRVEALNMPALLGPFLAQRGHREHVAGHFSEAKAILQRAVPICEEANDLVSAAHASMLLSWAHAMGGECQVGRDHGVRALRYLEQSPVPLFVTFTNLGLLLCAAFRGRWTEARMYGESGRDVGRAAHDDGLASFAEGFLAWCSYEQGEYAAAVAEARAAVELAPTNYFKGWAATYMAASMARLGQADEAVGILDPAVGYAEESGHVFGYALVALLRGEARVHAEQFEQARREMEVLRAMALTMPYRFVAAGALQVQGECALRTGNAAQAVALFQQAAKEFEAIDAAHRVRQVRASAERAMSAIRR